MRTLVIGLDCAAPEILLQQENLANFRKLMQRGCFGRLESVIPPITVPAWMCMSTSRDPGSLGVYGFRNRTDHTYKGLGVVNTNSFHAPAIWDILGARGKRVAVVAVPPSYPPRKLEGINIGCFLTPDTKTSDYTWPHELKQEIASVVEDYPPDVKGFRTDQKDWLFEQIYTMSRAHFEVVKHLLETKDWDYFQFVEIGLDRMHHGFWKYHDPQHRQYEPNHKFNTAVRDYYTYLDGELGELLDIVGDDTNIIVVSDHGAQRLDGGFAVNEWLRREGLLVLKEDPKEPRPFSPSLVDWSKTKVWSEGGYYARVFFNMEGREPEGIVPMADYDKFQDEMKARFEAIPDDRGNPMGTLVFKPKEIYKEVNNVAPDLIVHFGALYWRSLGMVGAESLYIQENDTGPDDCNHAQFGVFILASPKSDLRGRVEGMHLLDVAPTLLDLMGQKIPPAMQGQSLLAKQLSRA